MNTSVERDSFPPDLPLTKASFYSKGSSVANISAGTRGDYEYVAFDYDFQSGDMSHTESVVAIKTNSPKTPDTNLSRASGLQLERVGEWIFAFEARRMPISSDCGAVGFDLLTDDDRVTPAEKRSCFQRKEPAPIRPPSPRFVGGSAVTVLLIVIALFVWIHAQVYELTPKELNYWRVPPPPPPPPTPQEAQRLTKAD